MKRVFGLLGAGAALTYFFDPQQGAGRRAKMRDRLAGMFRSRVGQAEQLGRAASAQAGGVVEKVRHREEAPKGPVDDVTLARKVETEIFRDEEIPKGQINVNAENGKIVLRGEVGQPEMIRDLEERARSVQGVQDVENLLHLPGTEAPMHQ